MSRAAIPLLGMMKRDTGHTILELFREFQRLNRFITLDPSWALSLPASHAFVEIDAHRGIDIKSLAQILDLPRTSVATMVEGLVKRGLVSSVQSKSDRRQRALSLTSRGRTTLDAIDRTANARLVALLAVLSASEQDMLRELFRAIADGCRSADCMARGDEHPIRRELRRATRALRLIHADFMGSKIESPEWQVLSFLAKKGRVEGITEVAIALGIPLSSATTIAYRLRSRGFISFSKSTIDRRAASCAVTAKGRAFIAKVAGRMADRINDAVQLLNAREVAARVALLERVVRGRA